MDQSEQRTGAEDQSHTEEPSMERNWVRDNWVSSARPTLRPESGRTTLDIVAP